MWWYMDEWYWMVLCVVRAACKYHEVLLFPEGFVPTWQHACASCRILPDFSWFSRSNFVSKMSQIFPTCLGAENRLYVVNGWEHIWEFREVLGVWVTFEKIPRPGDVAHLLIWVCLKMKDIYRNRFAIVMQALLRYPSTFWYNMVQPEMGRAQNCWPQFILSAKPSWTIQISQFQYQSHSTVPLFWATNDSWGLFILGRVIAPWDAWAFRKPGAGPFRVTWRKRAQRTGS